MSKATKIDDLYDRWSEHSLNKHEPFSRNKKLFPVALREAQDSFTNRQVFRFLKGLHKGIYPRGKAWQRVD